MARKKFNKIKKRSPTLSVGDRVRVKTLSDDIGTAHRAYSIQFRQEFFLIDRINRKLPIPLYHLKAEKTGELIEGGFYREELQPVTGDVFKIEKILEWRRKRDGTREGLVRWHGYDENFDQWIPEDQIQFS